MMQDETRVEVVQGDEGSVETLAREALLSAEFARSDVVNPVNGTAPYTYVKFHGQRVEFHDGEWATMNERDAGSGKAAAYAQTINDSLFELAKRAVRIGMERAAFAAPPAGELRDMPADDEIRLLREALTIYGDRVRMARSSRPDLQQVIDYAFEHTPNRPAWGGDSETRHPLPADREAIAKKASWESCPVCTTQCTQRECAKGCILALSPTPSAGRDGSGA